MPSKSCNTTRLFTPYLNGIQLGPPLAVPTNDPNKPIGTLRFGKRTTGQTVNGRNAQFYGLLDDVAVFTRALSIAEIQSLSANALTGTEVGLLAGYTFDTGSQNSRLSRPRTLNPPATLVATSIVRNNTADAATLLLPQQQTEMTLPFFRGEAWQVIQGYDDLNGTHNGRASFSLDLVLADQPSQSAPFYAAAPGTVIKTKQDTLDDQGPCPPGTAVCPCPGNNVPPPPNAHNLVEVIQSPGEIAAYLHLQHSSAYVGGGDSVTRGQRLALIGDTGAGCEAYHLHFATTDLPEESPGFVTFPIAFSNYEVRDSAGNWNRVLRGIPQNGQVIRVP